MQVCAEDLIFFLRHENEKLRAALKEMLEAHSMENVGLEASKRRLEAKKLAREALSG